MAMSPARSNQDKNSAILLIHCPDEKGIVVSITEFIYKNKGNILYLDQHVDNERGVFFMRIEWELLDFVIPIEKIGEFFQVLVAKRYNMQWKLYFSGDVPRMAVFVSKIPHCLYDILSRVQSGEWNVDIPFVISNHGDLRQVAEAYDVPYHVFPIGVENKIEQEQAELKLLEEAKIDFIVLARYMQILSNDFVSRFPDRIINIHHSFLPAFPGAKPYHSAHERGVKVIGATSHYVTPELDAGPIMEQDVVRVSHVDSIEDMIRKGRDLEKIVLSRAIWNHLQRKVLAFENRTVIFT
jgi:formyltetrahydrofolate deformylase